MDLPRVCVISLGGTIAMSRAEGSGGVVPALDAEALVSAIPELASVARVSTVSFRQLPGAHLSLDDVIALAQEIEEQLRAGTAGVVVTQGTDTLEEVAFALHLLVDRAEPVVVTGAMRNPTLPGADGPANLLGAVRVAACKEARGLGTVIVMNDEVHAARYVQKRHASSPAAFASAVGPIGWISEGRVTLAARPVETARYRYLRCAPGQPDHPVALLTVSLGDDGRLLPLLRGAGYEGLVVEAFGVGHVPALMVNALEELAQRMPVVLASRTGNGEVFRETYAFAGSESDLLRRGLIGAGSLDGPKARILLSLLLRSGAARAEIADAFAAWCGK